MSGEFLRIVDITKKFGAFTALQDVSLNVSEGEFVCLLGPSGCGKTTLLRVVAGLEEPSGGELYLRGRSITRLHPSKRDFGIVFQSYALFPNMTVRQNIAFGLKNRKMSRAKIGEETDSALRLVNMAEQADKYPGQLSGGQQQRVALARALALSPGFLLLDEPLSALDAKVRQKVRKEIKNLQQRLGITTIMVTHDQEEALTMADRIVVMNNACIRQVGTPQEVYNNPNSPFVADFVGTINFMHDHLSAHGGALKERMRRNTYKLKAIRPEHIRVSGEEEEGVCAVVKDIEFQGPAYRVSLSLRDDVEAVYGDDPVSMDVPAGAFHAANIRRGETLRVQFSEDHMFFYLLDMDPEYARAEDEEADV